MTEKAKMEQDILLLIKKYGLLKRNQVIRFFPGQEKAAERAMQSLQNRRRIFLDDHIVSLAGYDSYDHGLIAAVWVMLDFGKHKTIEQHFCHDSLEYPIRVYFYTADNIEYDILYLSEPELIIAQKALSRQNKNMCSHIVVVSDRHMIDSLELDDVVCYCTVDELGEVIYYR